MPLAGSDIPLFDVRVQVLTRDGAPVNPATVFSIDVEDDQFSPLPGMGFFTSTGSAWSAWVPFTLAAANAAVASTPNAQASGFPLVLAVGVTPNGASLMQVGVEVRFNATPSVVWSMNPVLLGREYYSGNLAFSGMELLIYLDGAGAPVAQRGQQWNKQFLWDPAAASAIPIGQRPSRLILIDSVLRRGDEIDYVGEVGAALASLGYTCPEFPASAQYRAALVAAGLPHIRQSLAIPLDSYNDYGLTNVPALLAAWAQKYFGVYLTAGYAGTDLVSMGIQDEPGIYQPRDKTALIADATALTRFQAYLRGDYAGSFGPTPGFVPADFGQSTWAAVQPTGRGSVILGNESLVARRLFYWSMRFFAWDAARYTAAATSAIQTTLGLSSVAPAATNWNNYGGRFYCPWFGANNPDSGSADASSGAHDWWEFSRLGGGGVLYGEDWHQDGVAWLASYYGNRLRCAAQAGGRRFGYYQIPLRANPRPFGPLQKFAAMISHGASEIFHYKIGPGPLENQVAYAPIDPQAIPKIAACHRWVAPAEPFLVGGTLQGCGVAILAPRTSYAYDLRTEASGLHQCGDTTWSPWLYSMDYIVEQFGVWKALADSGIPCDFIDEDLLTSSGLAGTRVLYVTEQHLPVERTQAVAALLAWVTGGGTLVLGPNAASRDETDAPNTTLETASGIVAATRAPAWSHNDADASGGTVTGPGGTATIYGPKATLSATGGATVYATRSDGTPAILVQPIGLGRIIYCTCNLGMSYWRSRAPSSDGQPPGFSVDLTHGFSALLRAWITYPCALAGVVAPAACNTPEVELLVWKSALGLAVCLNNWTGSDSLPSFSLAVPLNTAPSSVTLTSKAPAPSATYAGGVLTASWALGPADVLLLSGGGVSVEEVGEIGLVGVTEVH